MMSWGATTKRLTRWVFACALPLVGGVVACFPDRAVIEGECKKVSQSILDCRIPRENGALQPAGLEGYACTDSMRPDLEGTVTDGVPSGLLCADKDPLATGEQTYCCTDENVPCVYDPSEECEAGYVGYQCYGNNRPESLNPSILCSNGTQEHGLNHYCCSGRAEKSPCTESTAVGCSSRLLGFVCEGKTLPKGEDYGANKSRADTFFPICSVAKPAPNPALNMYCCFISTPIPVGGSCIRQASVPGCEPGRFGFACYGPDGPEEDFPTMKCPEPGFPGTSAEGYEAKLYCCDFT